MNRNLSITSAEPMPALLDLPWDLPLANWPKELLASLPHGISRHVVKFVHFDKHILAIKEITDHVAIREYEALRTLMRDEAPCVEPLAVVSGRTDKYGNPLPAALITQHLAFSLPYRSLFAQGPMRLETADRLIGALVVLMVRLHLLNFFWGDVSLSNTLFRRDAEEFAAYLVDAETGEFYPQMSSKRRMYDIDVASVNIVGELMDLQAGGIIPTNIDPVLMGKSFEYRYTSLWNELTQEEEFSARERWKIDNRIRRLNDLGFDVGELSMTSSTEGTISIQPRIVDPGHYSRKIMQLTGMDVQEKQARRMFNSIEQFGLINQMDNMPMSLIAHAWITQLFEPIIHRIPKEMRAKLEPAQVFHELLDHRWFMSERAGREIPLEDAVDSYIYEVLQHRPDESHLVEIIDPRETGEFNAVQTQQEFARNFYQDFDDEWSGYMT